jgi:hypothetical protein
VHQIVDRRYCKQDAGHAGRVQFSVPMLFTLGFIVTFVIGGMTGTSGLAPMVKKWCSQTVNESTVITAVA